MEIKEIGKRGVLFHNDKYEVTYLIKGNKYNIICDTSSKGPSYMKEIENYLKKKELNNKEILVFNSHADYDHIWGNCYFKGVNIISSKACYEVMKDKAEFELFIHQEHHNNDIEIVYPTITFDHRLVLEEEGVEFIYHPGHTIDSAVCYDKEDRVLFTGDLIEAPLPYFMYDNLNEYLETLNALKEYDVDVMVNGHNGVVKKELIDENSQYIKDVLNGNEVNYLDEKVFPMHYFNLKLLLVSHYDLKIKTLLKHNFNYYQYRMNLWDFIKTKTNLNDDVRMFNLQEIEYDKLKEILEEFITQISL